MIDLKQSTSSCVAPLGPGGRCQAASRYSVSEHIGQDTDYRVCGRHLTWLLTYFADRGERVVVVAHLSRGTHA